MADTKIGGILAELKLSSTKFSKGINTASKKMNRFKRGVGGVGKSLIALAGIGGLGLLATKVVSTFATFEQSLANVKAVLRTTGDEMVKLTAKATELGSKTAFSASQAAEAMEFLGRAGFTTGQIIEAIEPTLNLAAAGSIELAEAADIASNVLSGFGKDASELSKVVDVMAAVTSKSNTDIRQLGDALKFVAPVARGFKVSVEESAAAVGILSNAGLQATLAGTGLRKILTILGNPTEVLKDKMQGLTVETDGLIPVLNQLRRSGITTSESMQLFGDRAGPAFNVLVNATADVEKLNKALLTAGGTAKEMAETKMDTLQGSFLRLKSATEGFINALGDSGLGKALRGTVDLFVELLQDVNEVQRIFKELSKDTLENRFNNIKNQADDLRKRLQKLNEISTFGTFGSGGSAQLNQQKEALQERIKLLDEEAKKMEVVLIRNIKLAAQRQKMLQLEQMINKAIREGLDLTQQFESPLAGLNRRIEKAIAGGLNLEPQFGTEPEPSEPFPKPFNLRGKFFGGEFFGGQGLSEEAEIAPMNFAIDRGKKVQEKAALAAKIYRDVLNPISDAQKQFDEYSKAIETFRLTFDTAPGAPVLSDAAIEIAKSNEAIRLGLINVGEAFDETKDKSNEYGFEIERLAGLFAKPRDEVLELALAMRQFGEDSNKSAEEIDAAITRMKESFGQFNEFEKQVLESMEAIRSGVEASLTDIFESAIDGTSSFRDAFLGILKVIRREIIRTFIVAQLLKALGGVFSGFTGFGGGTGGVETTLFDSFGDALAHGGPAKKGGAFLVGEEGPELFVPGATGTIVPNNELAGFGGQIVLNVTTGVQATVEAEMIRLLPEIQETMKAGIADARLRGGQFSKAMGI